VLEAIYQNLDLHLILPTSKLLFN